MATPTAAAAVAALTKVRRPLTPTGSVTSNGLVASWSRSSAVERAAPKRALRLATPTNPATIATNQPATAERWGSDAAASAPTKAKAPNTIQAIRNRFDAAIPVHMPSNSEITVMPMISAGLSLVPSVSIAHRSTEPGTLSITTSPTRVTSDGMRELMPDNSSPTPSASPAARIPDTPAIPREISVAESSADPSRCSTVVSTSSGSCAVSVISSLMAGLSDLQYPWPSPKSGRATTKHLVKGCPGRRRRAAPR